MVINKFPISSYALHIPLYKKAITLLQNYLQHLGYQPQIHFELEGCYFAEQNVNHDANKLDYDLINQHLKHLDIDGEIVPEYWKNQWEYVSKFNGQSPLKEADNLYNAIEQLPLLFPKLYAKQGVSKVLIQPVVWCGDEGKMADGSGHIFSNDTRSVHIPNAVQLNVSVLNANKENLLANEYFGEYLQSCFLKTSLACCLLYLPEESAFERLALKTRYGLADELCSPVDISGGHQGSVALYKKLGKHNQNMGEEPLLYDRYHRVLSVQQNWQKTARVEHRLGASSKLYNPYINIMYGLLNIIDALHIYEVQKNECSETFSPIPLPASLYNSTKGIGAIELFQQDKWFCDSLNKVQQKYNALKALASIDCPMDIGDKIKATVLENYQIIVTN
jgi:hypothetical protein